MTYCEYAPHPALAPFVDRFWSNAGTLGLARSASRILPDGCIDVVVDLEDGARAHVVGAMTSAMVLEPAAELCLLGVRFRPGGATSFLGSSAAELTDRVTDACDLGRPWLDRIRELEACTLPSAVRALQTVLLAGLSAAPAPDLRVAHVVSALFAPEPPSIANLAQDLGWSRQHLARTLKEQVGVSPVQLARVARLQRALDALQRRAYASLAQAALQLGYFDQAHLARDFRELAGITPREAASSAGSIFPIHSLLGDYSSAHQQ
jgi:AraC-like DNA-binding protein